MSKHFDPTVGWVITCDWPECGKQFVVGVNNGTEHFQCGIHHGIIPQKDRPEFQLPKDVEVNEDLLVKEGIKENE